MMEPRRAQLDAIELSAVHSRIDSIESDMRYLGWLAAIDFMMILTAMLVYLWRV